MGHRKVRPEVMWRDIGDICVGVELGNVTPHRNIYLHSFYECSPEETAVKTTSRHSPACGKCHIALNMVLCFMVTLLQTTPPPSRPIQQPPLSTKEQVLRETGEFTCETAVKKVHISLFSLIQLFIGEEFVKYYTLWR